MSKKMTRRQALTTGAASPGLFLGAGCVSTSEVDPSHTQDQKGPGREAFWGPGPNKNLVRDLTAGTTPIIHR